MAKAKELSPLEKIQKDIRAKYGAESVVDFSDESAMRVERLVTDSPRMNRVFGGGIPRGRIIEIYGMESSGKTTMASYIAGQFQAQGELVGFIDAEHALDPEYAKTLGYNAAIGVFSQPDSGEEGLNILADLCLSGAVGLVIVDSVAALTPQKELDGEIGDSNIGLQARMMSQAMRKLRGAAKQSGTTVIFINQIRMKIGVMFGNPETTAGGMALKFYASVRIEIRRKELLSVEEKADQEQSAFGQISWYKTVKNKTAPPFKRADMKIIYGKGLQIEEEWIEACVKSGIIGKGGAGWMTLPSGEKVQGMAALIDLLKDLPKLKEELISKVKAYELTSHANYIEEEEDNPTDDEVVGLLTDAEVEAELDAKN